MPAPRRASAGQRDHLIAMVKQVDSVASGSGYTKKTDSTRYEFFAERIDMWSQERVVGGPQVSARMETQWKMPFRDEIDPETVDVPGSFKLVQGSRTHDIIGAQRIGRKVGVLITTTSRVG